MSKRQGNQTGRSNTGGFLRVNVAWIKLLQEESWKNEWKSKNISRSRDLHLSRISVFEKPLESRLNAESRERKTALEAQGLEDKVQNRVHLLEELSCQTSQAVTKRPLQGRAERNIIAERIEGSLHQARANRELMATVMDQDWLGLECLAQLRSSPHISAVDLVSAIGKTIDLVGPPLARLVQFGAVNMHDRLFVCTDRGIELLRNIEKAADVDLEPQDP